MTVSLLKDRYELQSKLGSGGFSTVFAAHDTLLDREVAIKVLKASLHEDEELVQRFLLEAKLTSKLSHPNSLTVHDFGRDEQGHCFFVTELLIGQSLHERLHTKALSVGESLSVVAQVSLALSEAHDKEVVHRDIKPGNIFLCDQGNGAEPFVKLLDFGIAKSIGFDGQTVTGQMMGTPTYMSPEQIVNIKEVDHRSDIYSLGIVLFHMLSGAPPFKAESYFDTMRMHMQSPLPPLKLPLIGSEAHKALTSLLKGMTAKDKHKRYNKATDLHKALMSVKETISATELVKPLTTTSLHTSVEDLNIEETQVTPISIAPHSNQELPNNQQSSAVSRLPYETKTTQVFDDTHQKPHDESLSPAQSSTPNNSDRRSTKDGSLQGVDYEEVIEWRDSPISISDDPFDFLRDTAPVDLDSAVPHDPFAISVSDKSNSHRSVTQRPPSIKLKSQGESSGELKSSYDFVRAPNAKERDDKAVDKSSSDDEFTYSASRDAQLSQIAPSPAKIFRILILDPNEFAGELYKKGLDSGSERRAKQRLSNGISTSDMLSVSISTTEKDLLEDMEWGADLLLVDLKARDGARESEGIPLLKSLREVCPKKCRIIALCKDPIHSMDAVEAGADAVLNKPVQNNQLFDAVSVYLWK